jgi:peptide/nickel transport system permease protein
MAYFVRRLAVAALLVFVVSSGALLLARLAPGDITSEVLGAGASRETVARERARYGLDRPFAAQYGQWLLDAVRLDLGTSMMYGRPVRELVGRSAANTAILAAAALALATLLGLPLGIIAGSRRGGVLAGAIRALSLVCLSAPSLVTSLVLVLVAARTGWFPIGGMVSIEATNAGWAAYLKDLAWHLPVPAVALALPVAAMLERLQAQAMAEAVGEPCILAAFARGVPRRRLVWRTAPRMAARPVASVYGLVVGGLLSGSFAVEVVTAWPGLGRLMYDALRSRDLYLVAGCAAAGAVFLALGSLLSDAALALVDPRLRPARRAA